MSDLLNSNRKKIENSWFLQNTGDTVVLRAILVESHAKTLLPGGTLTVAGCSYSKFLQDMMEIQQFKCIPLHWGDVVALLWGTFSGFV